jgi:hypothetical protein
MPIPVPQRKAKDVENLVCSLYDLLRCVMSRFVTAEVITKTEYAVRIYLSYADALDATIRKDSDSPSVVSQFNNLCLLNLPETMSLYGPLRNIWEGGFRGEGLLKMVKPLVRQGLKGNWHFNLLRNFLIHKSFDSLLTERPPEPCSLFLAAALADRSRKFRKHESQLQVTWLVNDRLDRNSKKPISAIVLDNGIVGEECIFAVVGNYETVVQIHIDPNYREAKTKWGFSYVKVHVDENEEPKHWVDDVTSKMNKVRIGYVVLLPLLAVDPVEENRLFAIVSSNWKVFGDATTLADLIDDDFENR